MITFWIISTIIVTGLAVYYFGFYKKGKINDRDGDYIPDEIEDTIEDVKEAAKEAKRRAKAVKKELKDVVEESKDVIDAIKGKKRRGRKQKSKK
jgi:F0F1-type ATP synthase membrane subunit b/b'